MGAMQQALCAGSGPIVYATWDPANKGANLALTGGNLTATTVLGNNNSGVRSTVGKSSGKPYWENKHTASNEGNTGICDSSYNFAGYLGGDTHGVSYDSNDGKLYYNNAAVATGGATYILNDVIGMALDVGASTIAFYKNNVLQYTYTFSLTGTIYAANGDFGTASSTANFGATALTYTPPTGYTAGLY